MSLITADLLNRFWTNGVKPIAESLADLKSKAITQSTISSQSVHYADTAGTAASAQTATKATTANTAAQATKLANRQLTIGGCGRTFNGTGDVSWPLSEIGALPTAGGTMTGALHLANGVWNVCGDDAYFGDCNVGGCISIKGITAGENTGIALFGSGTSNRVYNRVAVANDGSDMYLCTNGSVFVSNGANSARAAIHASAFSQDSSRRVKENIDDVSEEDALKLLQLTPVNFDYIGDEAPKDCVGLIAEDVAPLFPKCVTGDVNCADDDVEAIKAIGIDYSKLTVYLIKLAQIQQKQISALERKIEEMGA